jgi:hypothetical protein
MIDTTEIYDDESVGFGKFSKFPENKLDTIVSKLSEKKKNENSVIDLSTSTILSKFEEEEEDFTSFSHAMSASLSSLSTLYSHMPEGILKPEDEELAQLTQDLMHLNSQTREALEIAPLSPDSAEHESRQRVLDVLQQLRNLDVENSQMHSHVGILGDSWHIEGHQLDFYRQNDGKVVVRFKLTEKGISVFEYAVKPTIDPETITEGKLKFSTQDDFSVKDLGDADVVKVNDYTSISVAQGAESQNSAELDYSQPILVDGVIVNYKVKHVRNLVRQIRSGIGAVAIEVANGLSDDEIATCIQQAFEVLDIPDGCTIPEIEEENDNKVAQYIWHHKLSRDVFESDETARQEVIDTTERQEVFPGYYTFVQPGASDRYTDAGESVLTHVLQNPTTLGNILKYGLMSSSARYSSGMNINGLSTDIDFEKGGADSVFLRNTILTKNKWVDLIEGKHNFVITFDPSILDRLDWYAYHSDEYGTTHPSKFDQRPAPIDFFLEQQELYRSHNEIMMRRGISPDMITGIFVSEDNMYLPSTITQLQKLGFDAHQISSLIHVVKNEQAIKEILDKKGKQQQHD